MNVPYYPPLPDCPLCQRKTRMAQGDLRAFCGVCGIWCETLEELAPKTQRSVPKRCAWVSTFGNQCQGDAAPGFDVCEQCKNWSIDDFDD